MSHWGDGLTQAQRVTVKRIRAEHGSHARGSPPGSKGMGPQDVSTRWWVRVLGMRPIRKLELIYRPYEGQEYVWEIAADGTVL